MVTSYTVVPKEEVALTTSSNQEEGAVIIPGYGTMSPSHYTKIASSTTSVPSKHRISQVIREANANVVPPSLNTTGNRLFDTPSSLPVRKTTILRRKKGGKKLKAYDSEISVSLKIADDNLFYSLFF